MTYNTVKKQFNIINNRLSSCMCFNQIKNMESFNERDH